MVVGAAGNYQDKLKETNTTIQNKMELEAQEAQAQRAEIGRFRNEIFKTKNTLYS